jgi:3-oxoacyl-[acyl-carrier-protein] synthase II
MKAGRASILAAGWVTPWGSDAAEIRAAVERGELARLSSKLREMELPWSGERMVFLGLPTELEKELGRLPRLRRASGISYAAVGAARQCLRSWAGELPEPERRAVLFAASDGSVSFTRKFYAGIEENGAGGGSPLLFPETVFNAPASHLCATLGWTGEALSLVGDACSSMQAGSLGADLLETGEAEMALVVAAQEADPISMAAYGAWGIGGDSKSKERVIFSEGAGAVLLGRVGSAGGLGVEVEFHPGLLRRAGESTAALMEKLAGELAVEDEAGLLVVVSGVDEAAVEFRAAKRMFPSAKVLQPRAVLGEALCAASMWQLLLAADCLAHPGEGEAFSRVFIPVYGYQGQAGAAVVSRSSLSP